jgi:hypothetical protein
MNIKLPDPRLSKTEHEIIELLCKHIEESINKETSNFQKGEVVLDEKTAQKLAILLENLKKEENFTSRAFVVESIFGGTFSYGSGAYRVYLSGSNKHRGKPLFWGRKSWTELVSRLGERSRLHVEKLPRERFARMEELLFRVIIERKYPNAAALCYDQAIKFSDRFFKERNLPTIKFDIIEQINNIKNDIEEGVQNLPPKKASGLVVLLSNLSVLFTTRDWGAVSAVSAMSGITMQIISED